MLKVMIEKLRGMLQMGNHHSFNLRPDKASPSHTQYLGFVSNIDLATTFLLTPDSKRLLGTHCIYFSLCLSATRTKFPQVCFASAPQHLRPQAQSQIAIPRQRPPGTQPLLPEAPSPRNKRPLLCYTEQTISPRLPNHTELKGTLSSTFLSCLNLLS